MGTPDLNKLLDRLIEHFGFEAVQEALAAWEPALPRGRHSTADKDMALAEWVYRKAEEYRQAEEPNPVERGELDRYDFEFKGVSKYKRIPFTKWQSRHEEKRLRGRKELRGR